MKWHKQINWPITGILFAAIAFHWAINHVGTVAGILSGILGLFSPFLLGCAIAFIFNVPMRHIEKRLFSGNSKLSGSLKRGIAYICTLLLVVFIISVALFVIVPQLGESMSTLVEQIPDALASAQKWGAEIAAEYPEISQWIMEFDFSEFNLNMEHLTSQVVESIKVWAADVVDFGVSAVGSVVSAAVNFLIGFVFSIYLLLQKEKLAAQSRQIAYAFLPETAADRVIEIAHFSFRTFSSFLSGQCTEAIILGMLFFVSMSLLRMPYALMIGVLIAVTALIPIVGAFIGCFIGAFMILIVNPMQALFFVVLFLILQQIEGNLIYPHVVGNSVGLPSIWVLAAVTVGGKLLGVAGMLIFIPLCSVCYALFRGVVKERLKKKGIAGKKLEYAGVESVYAPCGNKDDTVK